MLTSGHFKRFRGNTKELFYYAKVNIFRGKINILKSTVGIDLRARNNMHQETS
jgi:hypothetical protein